MPFEFILNRHLQLSFDVVVRCYIRNITISKEIVLRSDFEIFPKRIKICGEFIINLYDKRMMCPTYWVHNLYVPDYPNDETAAKNTFIPNANTF